jgi:hypothetical protein
MELEMLEDWLNNPEPAGELAEVELSEKVTEQQASQEKTREMNSVVGWQVKATEEEDDDEDEDGMGDHSDLPNCRKFLQLGRLQKQSQPLEQLDEVIEKIRNLMIRSTETASEEKLRREEEAAAAAAVEQQGSGARRQLQKMIWDPGGFPKLRVEAHE